jgi:hypothetical protein
MEAIMIDLITPESLLPIAEEHGYEVCGLCAALLNGLHLACLTTEGHIYPIKLRVSDSGQEYTYSWLACDETLCGLATPPYFQRGMLLLASAECLADQDRFMRFLYERRPDLAGVPLDANILPADELEDLVMEFALRVA